MKMDCDVLVVGGGPAGSSAARTCAKKGLKTIIIEEDTEIGKPVQCAEAVGKYLFPYMPINIPKNQLLWEIQGMYFWADDLAIIRKGGLYEGFSINRTNWDQWLMNLAINEGATLFLNAQFKQIEYNSKLEIEKILINLDGKNVSIEPTFVIAADGVNSTILNQIEMKKNNSIGHVKSFEMENLCLKYPRLEQLFFGNFAPGAYAYIFPLSKTSANIGIGTLKDKKTISDLFENFLRIPFVKKQVCNGKNVREKSGDAPIRNLSKKIVYGNIFLVGDSANQNIKPFIEGNIPSIICGDLLAKIVYDIKEGNKKPDDYPLYINEKFNLIRESQPYADLVYNDSKIESSIFHLLLLALMSEIIKPNQNEFNHYLSKGYDELKKIILQNGGFVEKNL